MGNIEKKLIQYQKINLPNNLRVKENDGKVIGYRKPIEVKKYNPESCFDL
jgi:hypothetical protein